MLIWDHQQVTASWVAGIIEGEGNFHNSKKSKYSIEVRISNTNLDLLKACERFFHKTGILCNIYRETKRKNWKTAYSLQIYGNDCYNLYNFMKPVLQCRIDEFSKLVGTSETVCDSRLTSDSDWLIGIWQAEGSFYLQLNGNRTKINPTLSIANTNFKIMDKVAITLKSLDCAFHVTKYNPIRKKSYLLFNITGILRCKRFLDIFKDRWIGERDIKRSKLMLEFIESRLVKDIREKYSEKENQIFHLMKDLNKRGVPVRSNSETVRVEQK